ncbi:MAG: rhodanese-like domain-containing protein [Pseudomonadota bacterium]|nr:rhodanese-like domain-containing protein [Pseudomonadota bacterium]
MRTCLLTAFAIMASSPAMAGAPPPDTGSRAETPAVRPANPQIDYHGFLELTARLQPYREGRLLAREAFFAKARQEDALILDTRSASAFAAGHIRGAVNLPFSDFTDEKLAAVLGEDKERPILIYCNNNFTDDTPPIMKKRMELALNIPTFVNLVGYGYANVWELDGVMPVSEVPWVTPQS